MKDLYQVQCPTCGDYHFALLEENPKENESVQVVCERCKPVNPDKGTFSF